MGSQWSQRLDNTPQDLRIQVGDVLEILDDNGDGTWLVRNQRTNLNALMPNKYKQDNQNLKNRLIHDEISAQEEP